LGNSIQTVHSGAAASNGNSAEKGQVSGAKNETIPVAPPLGERKIISSSSGPVAKENGGEDGSPSQHQGQQVGKTGGTKATEQKVGGAAETNHAS